jgi:anthranilate phosphoribosyltransferase
MREKSVRIHPKVKNLVDTCGTGGDLSHTLNISTLSAIIASSIGIPIAKHGNRSVSSKCGSADILEALGVNVNLSEQRVQESIEKISFGFIFAPLFHPAIKYAAPARKEIGIRTIFNILGPLTNPADAKIQILGVFSEKLTEPLAQVLSNLGSKNVMVVHGMDGLDEISISAETKVSELRGGKIKNYFIKPEDYGLKRCKIEELRVNNIEEAKLAALDVLTGKEKGAKRWIVALNAAAAVYLYGKAKNISDGVKMAAEAVDSGSAMKKLDDIRKFSQGEW